MNRRKREVTVLPDGRLFDEATFRMYLRALDARAPKRATVERLSRAAA
jgi:hypothetical protein